MKETIVAEIENKEVEKELLNVAKYSYSPYSFCKVACVFLFKNGEMISGCNVENASYPCGICAEQTAVVKSISSGKNLKDIKAIYIMSNKEQMFFPCGLCRQILSEHIDGETTITIYSKKLKNGTYKQVKVKLKALLPCEFTLD